MARCAAKTDAEWKEEFDRWLAERTAEWAPPVKLEPIPAPTPDEVRDRVEGWVGKLKLETRASQRSGRAGEWRNAANAFHLDIGAELELRARAPGFPDTYLSAPVGEDSPPAGQEESSGSKPSTDGADATDPTD